MVPSVSTQPSYQLRLTLSLSLSASLPVSAPGFSSQHLTYLFSSYLFLLSPLLLISLSVFVWSRLALRWKKPDSERYAFYPGSVTSPGYMSYLPSLFPPPPHSPQVSQIFLFAVICHWEEGLYSGKWSFV